VILAFRTIVLGSLALVAVASAPVASAAPRLADSSEQPITIGDFAFLPAEVTAPVGTSLTWTNVQPGVPHTTSSVDGVWDSGILSTGDAFTVAFNQPGDFAYECQVHPSMRGVIHIVATEPAAAEAAESVESVEAVNPADSGESAPVAVDAVEPAPAASADPTATPALPAPTPTPTPTVVPTLAPTPAPVRRGIDGQALPTPTPASSYGY
jgi:plastocyanin